MVGHATRGRLSRGGWVVAGSLALALAIGAAGAARADEVDDLRAEVEQLKQQMLYLQNQIPGASAGLDSRRFLPEWNTASDSSDEIRPAFSALTG